ncbi:MAG: uracil-DNA glycosylase [Succinivibrio sp.]
MAQWNDIIGPLKSTPEFKNAYFYQKDLRAKGVTVYPPEKQIFNAFVYTPLDKLKVVIIGQDPYHEKGQAMGLSFSVPVGVKIPPSLVNIYKELETDIKGFVRPNHGNLIPWARQGVLLLNAVLTVTEGQADSHRNTGWMAFTDNVIKAINDSCSNIVFLLWGNSAIQKAKLIDKTRHLILTAAHPSPLSASRGFFGCHHFSRTNEFLSSRGIRPIDWRLPPVLCGDEEL